MDDWLDEIERTLTLATVKNKKDLSFYGVSFTEEEIAEVTRNMAFLMDTIKKSFKEGSFEEVGMILSEKSSSRKLVELVKTKVR